MGASLHFSCHWQASIGESQKDRTFYRGRTLETITFSGQGSPVSCKLYNKTAEIKQRSPGKVWFYDRWLARKRADGTAVWDGKAVNTNFKLVVLHNYPGESISYCFGLRRHLTGMRKWKKESRVTRINRQIRPV